MTELFRTSLFGYSKKRVHAYISEINEGFSQKLLEKDMASKEAVQVLREQLEQLQRENDQLRAERNEVAGALIDAKTFATGLMEQAEAENRTQREKNSAIQQAELQQVQLLTSHVDNLRQTFQAILHGMDKELEQYRMKCQSIRTDYCANIAENETEPAQQEPVH